MKPQLLAFFVLIYAFSCVSFAKEKRDFNPAGTYNYTTTGCSLDFACSACNQMFFGQKLNIEFNGSNFVIPKQNLGYDNITGTISNNPFPIPTIVAQVNIGQVSFACNGSLDVGGSVVTLRCNFFVCVARIEYTCTTNCPSFFAVTTEAPPPPTTSNVPATSGTTLVQNTIVDPPSQGQTTSSQTGAELPQSPQTTLNENSLLGLLGLVAIVPLFALIAGILVLLRRIRRSKKNNSNSGERGIDLENLPHRPASKLQGYEGAELYIPKNDLIWQETIGSGNFGKVFRGEWNGISVALKTIVLENANDVTEEALMLKSLQHPNIITFYGLISDPETKTLSMVLEYLPKGDLGRYLITNKDSLTEENLQDFCLQIMRGMLYLQSKKVLHRDLAARNILVSLGDSAICLKIADFGLSRKMVKDQIYASTTHTSIPIRWAAPEVISNQIYSVASEVWSFGIVCWEIFSLGELPYSGFNNNEVIDMITRGFRLTKPQKCSDLFYQIVENCWISDPTKRPDFKSLIQTFETKFGTKQTFKSNVPSSASSSLSMPLGTSSYIVPSDRVQFYSE